MLLVSSTDSVAAMIMLFYYSLGQWKWGSHAPRGTQEGIQMFHRMVSAGRLQLTGEGTGQNTRGRVCYPKPTELLRISRSIGHGTHQLKSSGPPSHNDALPNVSIR